jgi:hypothetical protein
MVKPVAAVGVVCFVLLAACGAVCQDLRPSLPDAPLVQSAARAQRFNLIVEDGRSPLKVATMGGRDGVVRHSGFSVSEKAAFSSKDPDAIFRRYLYPTSVTQLSGYHSGNDGSLMRRATYAASRPLITRDLSGKSRLNTSYLLRTLTSVAKDAASTPYWRRSLAEPFSDFGSTVGNDAGMNLWHEFGPSIQQLLKNHTPGFVSRIEQRIGHSGS